MCETDIITDENIHSFKTFLVLEEKSPGTIAKYLHDVQMFRMYAGARPIKKETAIQWKEHLIEEDYAPVTINAMLSSVNCFFRFIGREDCRVKFLRVQRRMFRESSKVLTKAEYNKLVATAWTQKRERLALIMETICATGIRVSELKYITIEALQNRTAEISLKGKIRTILLPSKLCKKLMNYANKRKIAFGEVFLTKGGLSVSRRQIWAEMKKLCEAAGVESSKVFPHNLRHLFARLFYKVHKDIVKLADTLGHSSIDTTRIYLISTGIEHREYIEILNLVS